MTEQAERELHRLSRALAQIQRNYALTSRQLEALTKAGIALSHIFINKMEQRMNEDYMFLKNLDKQADKTTLKEWRHSGGRRV